jgi:hypothetical protein
MAPQARFIPSGQQVAPQQPTSGRIICDRCKRPIARGEKTVEIYIGMADESPQTGQPCVGPAPTGGSLTQAHWKCFVHHVIEDLVDEDDEDVLEPFYEWINEQAWELYEAEKEHLETVERLGERLDDPNS